MTLRVSFDTLGCKVNQYESESLATRFQTAGHIIVGPNESADVRVVNTCTVTNRAERKSRAHIYRARSHASAASGDGALLVITGCSVSGTANSSSLGSSVPLRHESLLIVDNDHKHDLVAIVEEALSRDSLPPVAVETGEQTAGGTVTSPPGPRDGARTGARVSDHTGGAHRFAYSPPDRLFRTRTPMKIQDGCDNRCSYCVIPFVRGGAVSRDPDAVIEEAQACVASGARELVVTGINIGRYRGGTARVSISELLEHLLQLDGDFRIRISSLEPDRFGDRFLRLFEHQRMERHLHLCLQSASDAVLSAMRRTYRSAGFRELARELRATDPLFNLTTDIIVGFPGETSEDVSQSLAMIEELEFGHVHTFPFSPRDGTRAAGMPGQINEHERQTRARQVRTAAAAAKRAYRRRLVGTCERVLVERAAAGAGTELRAQGFGEHYVPVTARAPQSDGTPLVTPNSFVTVRIEAVADSSVPGGDSVPASEPECRGSIVW